MTKRLPALALAASLAIGGAATLVLSGPAGAKPKVHHKAKPKPKLPTPHIGQVAKDGNFAFTVSSWIDARSQNQLPT